jgi:hypothetical protein
MDLQYNGQKLKKNKTPTMVVIILDGKLNIKQDGQTKNGSEGSFPREM